jgi:hypothetical protein
LIVLKVQALDFPFTMSSRLPLEVGKVYFPSPLLQRNAKTENRHKTNGQRLGSERPNGGRRQARTASVRIRTLRQVQRLTWEVGLAWISQFCYAWLVQQDQSAPTPLDALSAKAEYLGSA